MALEERDKKMLMVLGAVAGLAVLFLLFKMLTGGGEDPATVDATTGTDVTASPAVPATTPDEPAPAATPAPTTTELNGFVFTARDFFSPIPEPIVDVSATPSPSPGGSTDITPDNVNIDGHEIVLNEIIARKTPLSNVTVDGANFSVSAGEAFADGFTVLTIDTSVSCAQYEYKSGSLQDDFTLCVT